MNDLRLWPEPCNKNYDPHDLEVGDLLEFTSDFGHQAYIYEVTRRRDTYHGNPLRQGDIAMDLREISVTNTFELPEGNGPSESFPHFDPVESFIKRFKLKLKHKDKILKTNMCKVLAARVFANEELNQLLLELEI